MTEEGTELYVRVGGSAARRAFPSGRAAALRENVTLEGECHGHQVFQNRCGSPEREEGGENQKER